MVKSFVYDKDVVLLSLQTAEMASYYAEQGKTLLDVLNELYEQYGYYQEALISKTFEGKSGQEEMQQLLTAYREQPLTEIATLKVIATEDYLTGEKRYATDELEAIDLPNENVLKYTLEDGSWVAIRPSGTEPKCKFYVGVVGETMDIAQQKLTQITSTFK